MTPLLHQVAFRIFSFVAIALFALPLPVAAQETRGSITGRVTDASGAVIPNARVTATNLDTNIAPSVTTNQDGDYTIPYLLSGRYRLTVEAPGFKRTQRENVEVQIGDKLGIDLQLETGAVSDTGCD